MICIKVGESFNSEANITKVVRLVNNESVELALIGLVFWC